MTPELIETLNKFNWTNQKDIIELLNVVLEDHGPDGLRGVLEVGLGC